MTKTDRCAREEYLALTSFIETALRQEIPEPAQRPSVPLSSSLEAIKDQPTHAA